MAISQVGGLAKIILIQICVWATCKIYAVPWLEHIVTASEIFLDPSRKNWIQGICTINKLIIFAFCDAVKRIVKNFT
jgi:hypothetical protein